MSQHDKKIDRVSIGLGRTALALTPLAIGGCQALNQMHAEVFGDETSQEFLQELEQTFQSKTQEEVNSLAGKVMDANISKTSEKYDNKLTSFQHQGYNVEVHASQERDKQIRVTATKQINGQKCTLEVTLHKDQKYKIDKVQVDGRLIQNTTPQADGLIHYALDKAFQEKSLETQVYALDPQTNRLVFGTKDRVAQIVKGEVAQEASTISQMFENVYTGMKEHPYTSLASVLGLACIVVATIKYLRNKKFRKTDLEDEYF